MTRGKEEIISEILSVCIGGASKTRVVYQANLNFRSVNPYLDILIKNDLIEVGKGKGAVKELFTTTSKGEKLLRQLKHTQEETS